MTDPDDGKDPSAGTSPTESGASVFSTAPAAPHGSGPWAIVAFLVLVGLLVVAAVFIFGREKHPTLPRLALQPVSPQGEPVTLADLEGKVVLVNFWGTWCQPCVKEFPDIVAVEKHYRDRDDFRLLAVSCGQPQEDESDEATIARLRRDTQAFLDHRFVEMPTYLDRDRATRQAVEEVMQLTGYPTTLLLDRQHRIRYRWVGMGTKQQFIEEINKLLNE